MLEHAVQVFADYKSSFCTVYMPKVSICFYAVFIDIPKLNILLPRIHRHVSN